MKLRSVAPFAAIIFALLLMQFDTARAGGDLLAIEPKEHYGAGRPDTLREYYREPYGSDYGYAYGRTYIFGSYYRPYRTHYYSYALPNYYTHYYPRRRRSRWYNRAPRVRAPYNSYSYRYR